MTTEQTAPAADPWATSGAPTLNYRGDCRDVVGQLVGPNTLSEMLTIVDADYDPATDVTTVTLRYGVHEVPVPSAVSPEATDAR